MLIGMSGLANSGKDTAANFMVEHHGFVKIALADPLKRICKEVYDFSDEQLWGPSEMRNGPDHRYMQHPGGLFWACTACCHQFLGNPFEEKTIGGLGPKTCARCQKKGDGIDGDFHLVALPVQYLTPRHALQQLGTNWGRECYPNTWVDLCIRTSRKVLDDHSARYTQKDGIHHLYDNRTSEEADRIENTRVRGVAVPDVRFRNEMNAIQEAGGRVIRIVRPGAGLDGIHGQHVSETEQGSISDSEFDAVISNDGTLDDLRVKVETIL